MKEENFYIAAKGSKISGPKVSVIERFHCTSIFKSNYQVISAQYAYVYMYGATSATLAN